MIVNFKLLEPLAHGAFGDEQLGNYSAFRRIPVLVEGEVKKLPVISGNAIRGTMRRAIMRELYDAAGMTYNDDFISTFGASKAKRAWDRLYAALFGGGTIDNVDVNIQTEELRQLRADLPPLSLFGSALYSVLMPGCMNVGFAVPKCVESIKAGLWEGDRTNALCCAELLTDVGLTRHIDRENASPDETGVKPMPYQVEALVPGAEMQIEVSFDSIATDLEKDCAAHAVGLLKSFGGKSAVGFGKVEILNASEETGMYADWLKSDGLKNKLLELAARLL